MKSIQQAIRSILRLIFQSNFFKSLVNYAALDPGGKSIVPPPETNLAPEVIMQRTEPLLATELPIILVKCISCGTIHELTAVCQNCKNPVCGDDTFCRTEVFIDDLNLSVIQCRNCASNR